MKTRLFSIVVAVVIVLSLLPVTAVFAQEHGDSEDGHVATSTGGQTWGDVQKVAIWSIVSIAAGCALLSVLYLFKKQIGGFPEHPAWVAPITIMPASQLPGDDGDPHAQDGHGDHAPAH